MIALVFIINKVNPIFPGEVKFRLKDALHFLVSELKLRGPKFGGGNLGFRYALLTCICICICIVLVPPSEAGVVGSARCVSLV